MLNSHILWISSEFGKMWKLTLCAQRIQDSNKLPYDAICAQRIQDSDKLPYDAVCRLAF
jgi:hypothetical protein